MTSRFSGKTLLVSLIPRVLEPTKGRVLVANPGLAYVWVLNHRAEPVQVLRAETGTSLTNLAFGGPDGRTLYCTESTSGTILRAEMETAGAPVHTGAGASVAQ